MGRVATAGCDPHLDSISMSAIDGLGRELVSVTVPNSATGWEELTKLCARYRVGAVGVEAASGYGRCLSQRLSEAGMLVVEVPTRFTASERRTDGSSKTDPGDARAIARTVARGEGSVWVDDAALEQIRLLSHRRDDLVGAQTRDINQLRALLVEVDPQRAASTGRIRSRHQLVSLTRVRYQGDAHRQTAALLIRQLAQDCLRRHDHIKTLEAEMKRVLPPVGEALMGIQGIGLITACQILAEVAGTGGFPTDAKMAAWAGIAPLDASSGRQVRHRLNRGGNRRVNRAIHTIVITQQRHNGPAAHYITRRISQDNKTEKEAIRAAKRHTIRRIWKTLRDHGLT